MPIEPTLENTLGPSCVSIPVQFNLPDNLLPVYTSIKREYQITDDKLAEDCVHFALFCYQQGYVKMSGSLVDSLMQQNAAIARLSERIQQSSAAVRHATFISSAVIKAMLAESIKRRFIAEPHK